jgi:hypothetical protein
MGIFFFRGQKSLQLSTRLVGHINQVKRLRGNLQIEEY